MREKHKNVYHATKIQLRFLFALSGLPFLSLGLSLQKQNKNVGLRLSVTK